MLKSKLHGARVARAVARGVERRKPMLVVPPAYRLGYWLYRLAPAVYERLMARQFQSELDRS